MEKIQIKIVPNIDNLDLYEISISKLKVDIIGVDIDKNIPNGIKPIAQNNKKSVMENFRYKWLGERINSIPVKCKSYHCFKNLLSCKS